MLAAASHSIPDIHISRIHNQDDPDCDVHYETFGRLAEIFGRNTPVHRHSRFFQIHLLTRGSISLQLDDEVYSGVAPLAFFTPPAIPHAFYSENETEGHVITIRREVVRDWLSEMPGQWHESSARQAAFMVLNEATEALLPEITRLKVLAEFIHTEFSERNKGRSAALKALGQLFFITLNRLLSSDVPATPLKRERGEDLRIFLGFCDLVEARFREHLTLPNYASELAVTEARLNEVCRRMANISSKELIHDRLIQEARRLLRFSSTPISELCYQLGFTDPAYFSRFFARRAGMTPSQFRSQHQTPKL